MKKTLWLGLIILVIATAVYLFYPKNKTTDTLMFMENMKRNLVLSGKVEAVLGAYSTTSLSVMSDEVSKEGGRSFDDTIKTGQIFKLIYNDENAYTKVSNYLLNKLGKKIEAGMDVGELFANERLVCYNRGLYSGQGPLYVWCADIE